MEFFILVGLGLIMLHLSDIEKQAKETNRLLRKIAGEESRDKTPDPTANPPGDE